VAVEVADGARLVGEIQWVVRDRRGRFVRWGIIRNKTNNNARAVLAQWMTGTTNASNGAAPGPSQMQLGTGTGTPAATDTGLFTAASGTLVAISNQSVYQTYYAQYQGFWPSTTPAGNYSEVALFDPNLVLWAHVLLQTSANQPYIPLQLGQTLSVIWKINVLGN